MYLQVSMVSKTTVHRYRTADSLRNIWQGIFRHGKIGVMRQSVQQAYENDLEMFKSHLCNLSQPIGDIHKHSDSHTFGHIALRMYHICFGLSEA